MLHKSNRPGKIVYAISCKILTFCNALTMSSVGMLQRMNTASKLLVNDSNLTKTIKDETKAWKCDLSNEFKDWQECESICVHFLHMSYRYSYAAFTKSDARFKSINFNSHLQILLHHPCYRSNVMPASKMDKKVVVDAAGRITRMAEDMLSRNLTRFAQMSL